MCTSGGQGGVSEGREIQSEGDGELGKEGRN